MQGIGEKLLGSDHSNRLDGEDVLLLLLTQLDERIELIRADAFSTHGASINVFNIDLFFLLVLLDSEDTLRTESNQFLGILSLDRTLESDAGQ
jgi:hypothetical protein